MIRTTVSSKQIKLSLYKGFILGIIGIIGLFYGGIFLPVEILRTWGFLLFLTCLGMIILGLVPYRRLALLQSKPNELRLGENQSLEFWSKGQSRLIIPFKAIEKIQYVENGIALWIKGGQKEKIVRFQQDRDLGRYQVKTKNVDGSDYVFGYFSKRSFNELNEELRTEEA